MFQTEGNISLRIKSTTPGLKQQNPILTLHASTKKGNRPSYIRSAPPEVAVPLYQAFIQTLELAIGKTVPTGIFGADMKVALINDGPVTISIDSKRRE